VKKYLKNVKISDSNVYGSKHSRFYDFTLQVQNKNYFIKINQYFDDELTIQCLEEYNIKRQYLLDNSDKILNNFKINQSKIYKILNKNLFKKEDLIKIFDHFKIDYSFKSIGFETNEINDAKAITKFIRNRITSSDFS